MNFADLAGDETKKPSFGDLAGGHAPSRTAARRSTDDSSAEPTFQFNDPAEMRASLVRSNHPELVAAFDKQYSTVAPTQSAGAGRGSAPASDYWQAVHASSAANAPAVAGVEDPNSRSYQIAHGTGAADPMRLAAHVATGLGASAYGGFKGIGVGLKTLMLGGSKDEAINAAGDAVTDAQQQYTYNPDPNTATGQMAKSFDSKGNPLNWPAAAGDWAGGKLAEAGYPGAGAALNAGVTVLGLPAALKGASAARAPLMQLMRSAPDALPSPRVDPTMGAGPAAANDPSLVARPAEPPVSSAPPEQIPAAQQVQVPPTTPEQVFADHAPASNGATPLPAAEQTRRARVLQSVGLDSIRKSAIEGNGLEGATDAQIARLNTPGGAAMKAQLDNEKATLGNYADKLVQDTGGTTAADQTADYTRGSNITGALDGIKNWYDGNIKKLYGEADKRAQGAPATLGSFGEVMGDSSHLTNSDRIALKPALESYLKKAGMTVGEDGQISGTVAQAETVRKYLNEQWSPQNSRFVGALKDALDDDVTKSAGEDVYGEARKMRAQRAATLDNPNGIAKIMDSSGPNGINRTVATEKIPTAIASMPVDQLAHVVDTLKNAPPEVQPQAQAALAEIKAHFANQIRNVGTSQAGQFNAKGVGNYLRSNAARMSTVFEPEEMAGFKNLHDAGQILAKDQSYPGAYAQQQNLLQAGVSHAIGMGSTGIGSMVAGPAGAVVGNFVGGKLAGKFNDASTLRATQKRMVSLKDLAGDKP